VDQNATVPCMRKGIGSGCRPHGTAWDDAEATRHFRGSLMRTAPPDRP
jgi:hypothetical protein